MTIKIGNILPNGGNILAITIQFLEFQRQYSFMKMQIQCGNSPKILCKKTRTFGHVKEPRI